MQKYPYLVQQYNKWFVRMVIPANLRHLFPHANGKAKSVIKIATRQSCISQAQAVAAPIIARTKREIAQAKRTAQALISVLAERIAAEYAKRLDAR